MKARTFDELGYAVHTNDELPTMLVGERPLAMFHAVDFELPNEDFVPEVAFAPHVASGMMVRDSSDEQNDEWCEARFAS